MKKVSAKIMVMVFSSLLVMSNLKAQETSPVIPSGNKAEPGIQFDLYADFVSQYVWRGLQLHPEVNIQPGLIMSHKNLSLGVWTSAALASPFTEADLSLSYAFPAFTVSITDYYAVNHSFIIPKEYFNYSNRTESLTDHAFEISVVTNDIAGIPLNITAATFFYGNDKDESGKNLYSSYLEAAYKHEWQDYDLALFIGGSVIEGYYAEKAAVTNVGGSLKKEVGLNHSCKIVLSSGLVYNPNRDKLFFIFGFGI